MMTKRRTLLPSLVSAGLLLASSPSGQGVPPGDLSAADLAWDRGDYVNALEAYLRLLDGPASADALEPIALQTGDLFHTDEITPDGLSPQFNPDGRLVAYEAGADLNVVTRLASATGAHGLVAELPGRGAAFSPAGDRVAYLHVDLTADLIVAQQAVDAAEGGAQRLARQRRDWLLLKHAVIVERSLSSGRERRLPDGGLLKTGLVYAADGRTLYFLGAREEADDRSDIYAVRDGAAVPERLTGEDGVKNEILVDPAGRAVVYTSLPQNPFRRPESAEPGGGQGRGAGAGQRPGPGGDASVRRTFGIVHLATGQTRVVEGRSPALSADGSTLAYLAAEGGHNAVAVGPIFGTPVTVTRTASRVEAPAVSPDGRRVAYQVMTWDDWEIHVSSAEGGEETRLTREIQHDLQPRFIDGDRLIGLVGEARHRRSYLYDLGDGSRRRLFHNNTVRTIAPEYAWVLSRDGTKLLVGAERDGDTVSPERGIYLVDLSRRITPDDLRARLRAGLAAERDLRERGRRMFEPIADGVRRIVSDASVERVFEYEKALFDFDSKHITQPGNRKAAEYLFRTYASFGYAPEYQWFDARNAKDGRTANVLATLEGTENPELIYVVSSHYDSTAVGPGADDDSSGTAALLETARLLAGHPMPATIVFASFTGEEAGLLGSREWVRQAVEKELRVVGALNNDMIGWSNDHRLDNTIRYSNAGIRDVQHAAAMQFTKLITYDARYYKSTDAAAYYDAWGDIVGGIGSYPVLGNPHYHQPHDRLETINHGLIVEVAKTTAATLVLLASSPSRIEGLAVADAKNGTVRLTWTPSPERGVREYIVATAAPGGPLRERLRTAEPQASLSGLTPGTVVAVKAVNGRGLEGWDWGRVMIE